MRKFRLKKHYPGLHPDAFIAVPEGINQELYTIKNELENLTFGTVWCTNIVNEPEYWEEIIEKKKICTTEDGFDLFENDKCVVVGKNNEGDFVIINRHHFMNSMLFIRFFENVPKYLAFKNLENANKYIADHNKVYLTTEDGKDLRLGDKYYLVNFTKNDGKYLFGNGYTMNETFICLTNNAKAFSTYELALECFEKINRKPLFTTHDGVDIYSGMHYFKVGFTGDTCIEYATDDRDYDSDTTYGKRSFSTEEIARKFYNLNVKQYSIQDLINVFMPTKYICRLNNPHKISEYDGN